MQRLLEMLSHMRPHNSEAEKNWVAQYILPYAKKHDVSDHEGNIVIVTNPESKTLFSSHTDTVHSKGGEQKVVFDQNIMVAYKDDTDPLGADDGVGVWLMLEMIDAGVGGTFVFHRGEERGGIGSRWMKQNQADWLKQFHRAIAFDRKGRTDVITHQGSAECCSPEFAKALSEAIGLGYEPSDRGMFTDTKNYIGLIPECTNLSVGYEHEHTKDEMLDVEHALLMRDQLILIEWETLPTIREPKEPTYPVLYGKGRWKSWDDDYYYLDTDALWSSLTKHPYMLWQFSKKQLTALMWDDPERMANLMWALLHSGDKREHAKADR